MSDHVIEQEIEQQAFTIGCSTSYADLFDSQLSFWLSVQNLMRTEGYDGVRKRMSFISEDIAEIIASANLKSLRNLCLAEISTIRPSIPDTTIKAMLTGNEERSGSKMVLQLLAEQPTQVNTSD